MASEIEETVKRITAHKGVQSLVILNSEYIPIRTFPTTMDHFESVRFCSMVNNLFPKLNAMIKDLDPGNDFMHVRIRSKKNELLIYPEKEYILVVTQSAAACQM